MEGGGCGDLSAIVQRSVPRVVEDVEAVGEVVEVRQGDVHCGVGLSDGGSAGSVSGGGVN